jgi:hypothetical protein
LCNLWMKKSLFGEGFRFPAGYLRNEENILIGKLEKAQKKMLYTSDLIVFHERKKSFSKLIKVTYLSGKYRTYGFFDSKETINLWFFVPQVFIIVLTILSILKLSYFGLMFLVYILSIFIISIINTYQIKKVHLFPLAMNFYIIYNFVYPIGQFCGYLARCKRKRI